MEARIPGDILLFNGQGSKEHFSDRDTVVELEKYIGEDANSSFQLFLQQCLDAFQLECCSLNEKERIVLGCGSSEFYENTEALFFPPEKTRSHPVAETISLYMRQILELIVYSTQTKPRNRIIEVTGICTGLIPAVLAASTLSYNSPEFLESALHGFRLSFWVGLRSASICHDFLGDRALCSPWVLSTFSWPTKQLEMALTKFSRQQQHELNPTMQISAIFDNDVHSLSGPGQILAEFRSTMIPSSVQSRTAHVHGLYHGGSRMSDVVAKVLRDVESRDINFPTWDTLGAPLRVPTTGDRMIKGSSCQSLLETVLSSIFVEVCDWKKTREKLYDETIKCLAHDHTDRYRMLCVGPGTRSVLQGAPIHQRISIVGTVPELMEDDTEDMIAIVGMSINYPGASCLDELWSVLENAQCNASQIPLSRFDAPANLSGRLGNFLDDPFQFDSSFFSISPREAKSMDPQQRLLLQAAFEALEDSGYSPDSTPSFQRDTFGVFVGVATNDYVDNLRHQIDLYYSPGTLRAFLSGRISYAFNFLGPSIVVDTACSSSVVALYQACQAIRSGECTAALAGGVNTISSPDMYNGLARAHFLSPTGQCKPFDAAADGYCRAEGCGLLVVKKLSSAIEENDNIYGVIRGIGVNQCGTAKSITHPDYKTQAALFARLLSSSRVTPDSITVVEAHGTGTQAGDFAEILSLSSTFEPRSPSNPLHVSSIKGNIGHAEAASGIAGVAKLLAMIQRGQIPPQASFQSLNPRLNDHIHNMVVPKRLTEWVRSATQSPRRAMLCNFGAAGSNAALILEEYVPKRTATSRIKERMRSRSYHILNLSAKSENALQFLKDNFISYIETHSLMNINDLCYTTNARRQAHDGFRLSATGANLGQLVNSLRQSQSSRQKLDNEGLRKSVFVFSGQGHARKGMGAELLSTVPEFGIVVEKCDKILHENGFPGVAPFLSNSSDVYIEEYPGSEIVIAQCALFVLEFALARVWIQWGLLPDVVVGHSIGEYAAMVIAGILDARDALLLIARRAKLIATKCVPGMSGMVTCRTTVDNIQLVLGRNDPKLSGIDIACLNSQEDIVVSGPIESLDHFIKQCKANGIKARQLDVPYGFHSSCMDPILSDFESFVSIVNFSHAKVVVGSSLRGKLLDSDEKLQPDYFLQHTRDSVNFHHVIEDVEKSFPDTILDFIEIGPSPSTEPMIRRIIQKRPCQVLPSLRPTETPWKTLSQNLSYLFLQNHPIKWREVYYGMSAQLLKSIPKYPLNTSPGLDDQLSKPSFEFLGSAEPDLSTHMISFQTGLAPLTPYMKAHKVAGVPLCPASVLIEVVLEAFSISHNISNNSVYLLTDVCFESPLVCADQIANESSLEIELDVKVDKQARFSLNSNGQRHSSGLITHRSRSEVVDMLTRKSTFVKRQRRPSHQDSAPTFDLFSSKTIYDVIFPRVVVYDKPFLTLKKLAVSESRLEACGAIQLDGSYSRDRFVSHPAFIDTLLHTPGLIANIYVPTDVVCICTGIESAYLPTIQHLGEDEMTVYCNLTDVGHSIIADGYMINSEEKVVGFVEGCCFKKIPLNLFNNHLSRLKNFEGSAPMESIFLDICGIKMEPAMVDMTLVTLGIDSLLSIELSNELSERFGFVIDDSQQSISELTFNQLQEMVMVNSRTSNGDPKSPCPEACGTILTSAAEILSSKGHYDFQSVIQQQNHGPRKCDIYLFHDGSGYCNFYSRMSNMNRSIIGIFSPDPSPNIERLEDLASLYIKRTRLDKEQEVVLGGKFTDHCQATSTRLRFLLFTRLVIWRSLSFRSRTPATNPWSVGQGSNSDRFTTADRSRSPPS
ncbi:hypothetical protein F4859DRAFT_528304 [Xylaria cf. heliscus]|nr:hypothetical protein F4859DRAFT_528304 [Xylaria cf. heliscus]